MCTAAFSVVTVQYNKSWSFIIKNNSFMKCEAVQSARCVPTCCMHAQGRTSLDYLQARLWNCVLLLSTRFQYQISREKLRSSQLVSFMSLIWENVSTSQCYPQSNNIKYIKGIVYHCIKFWIKVWILYFDKLNFPLSKKNLFKKNWKY